MTDNADYGARCERTGKVKMTRRQALDAARYWRREQLARMQHYRCRCGAWHVGNVKRKPRHAR